MKKTILFSAFMLVMINAQTFGQAGDGVRLESVQRANRIFRKLPNFGFHVMAVSSDVFVKVYALPNRRLVQVLHAEYFFAEEIALSAQNIDADDYPDLRLLLSDDPKFPKYAEWIFQPETGQFMAK